MMNITNLYPSFDEWLIEEIEQGFIRASLKANEVIMRKGQYIKSTILVLKGKLKVYREDAFGKEFFMYYLTPGQGCAASMVRAQSLKSDTTVKVIEDSEVLLIPLALADRMMAESKSWFAFVLSTFHSRFDELLEVIDQVAFCNMDGRLENYLHQYAETNATHLLPLSHQEVANDLSTSREVISRLLKKMEQKGKLTLHRNTIELNKAIVS